MTGISLMVSAQGAAVCALDMSETQVRGGVYASSRLLPLQVGLSRKQTCSFWPPPNFVL